MKFVIGNDKDSAAYDSLDTSVPLGERFLALMLFKLISGDSSGVSASDLACTDKEIDELMESEDIDDVALDKILSFAPKFNH